MPPYDHHHHQSGGGTPKPNRKILSVILHAIIMTLITTFFFLFLGVAAILLLLATAALHHHNDRHNHHHLCNSRNGLSSNDLKRVPRFRFSKRTKFEADTECTVCLDGIRQGQWCRNLVGCGHVFHQKCVDAWLIRAPTCPICRTRVPVDVATQSQHKSLLGFQWTIQ